MFRNKIVVITGGAGGIGKCIADQFRNNGAEVCVIDTAEGDHYVGDIGSGKYWKLLQKPSLRNTDGWMCW